MLRQGRRTATWASTAGRALLRAASTLILIWGRPGLASTDSRSFWLDGGSHRQHKWDNLQTLQVTCNYQRNELHDSYDHTCMTLTLVWALWWQIREPKLHTLRVPRSKIWGPEKREKAVHLEVKSSRKKSFSFFCHGPLKATCPWLSLSVCLCFYDHVLLQCCKALRTMLLISMGGVYTY